MFAPTLSSAKRFMQNHAPWVSRDVDHETLIDSRIAFSARSVSKLLAATTDGKHSQARDEMLGNSKTVYTPTGKASGVSIVKRVSGHAPRRAVVLPK